jgi:hypothetical protein
MYSTVFKFSRKGNKRFEQRCRLLLMRASASASAKPPRPAAPAAAAAAAAAAASADAAYGALAAVDKSLADDVFPARRGAARRGVVKLQCAVRRLLARRLVEARFLAVFERDEAARRERQARQLADGMALMETLAITRRMTEGAILERHRDTRSGEESARALKAWSALPAAAPAPVPLQDHRAPTRISSHGAAPNTPGESKSGAPARVGRLAKPVLPSLGARDSAGGLGISAAELASQNKKHRLGFSLAPNGTSSSAIRLNNNKQNEKSDAFFEEQQSSCTASVSRGVPPPPSAPRPKYVRRPPSKQRTMVEATTIIESPKHNITSGSCNNKSGSGSVELKDQLVRELLEACTAKDVQPTRNDALDGDNTASANGLFSREGGLPSGGEGDHSGDRGWDSSSSGGSSCGGGSGSGSGGRAASPDSAYWQARVKEFQCDRNNLLKLRHVELETRVVALESLLGQISGDVMATLQDAADVEESVSILRITAKQLIERINPGGINIKTGGKKKKGWRWAPKNTVRKHFDTL